jgi:hypothetical protein
MKTSHLLILTGLFLLLTSCQSFRENKLNEDFDKATKNYFIMVRWHELEKAPLTFIDDPLRAEFKRRVEAARNVQISDFRVKNMECRPGESKGEVTVEWEYYLPPSFSLKTVEDPQKWEYVEENDKKGWMLKTLFPEFK